MLERVGVTRFAVIFTSLTIVNKMSSRLVETTLRIICKQITPLLPVCLLTLTLVYKDEACALCLKQRVCLAACKFGRYPSTRSLPLPLISLPAPFEVAVLRHGDSDQCGFQTRVWLRRPSQVPSLSSGLV